MDKTIRSIFVIFNKKFLSIFDLLYIVSRGMDDELEDRVLYQTYVSHMKLLSKFAVGIPPLNSSLAYLWKLIRFYMLKPEVLICGVIVFIFLVYLQAVEVWSRGFLGRIQSSLGYTRTFRTSKLHILSSSQAEKQSWEQKKDVSAVYAVQGRRPRMEDRCDYILLS